MSASCRMRSSGQPAKGLALSQWQWCGNLSRTSSAGEEDRDHSYYSCADYRPSCTQRTRWVRSSHCCQREHRLWVLRQVNPTELSGCTSSHPAPQLFPCLKGTLRIGRTTVSHTPPFAGDPSDNYVVTQNSCRTVRRIAVRYAMQCMMF